MIGVFVMAYGGPNNLDEVEPYLLDVRGYRPTSQEIIHEVRERYREIGGRSPILEQTQAQADALESALNVNGGQFKAYVGNASLASLHQGCAGEHASGRN
jgi:protoporphyrin/coproporphyrin ferrochelatase